MAGSHSDLMGAITQALDAVVAGGQSTTVHQVDTAIMEQLESAKRNAQAVVGTVELAVRQAAILKVLRVGGGGVDQRMIGAAIDLVRAMVEQGLASAGLLYRLLGDLFDALTYNECSLVFDHMETRIDMFTSKQFQTAQKISLLRMCNRLQQRLSRARDTVFCGRIRMFLSMVYPLSEKSALNLYSKFNVENTTEFTEVDEEGAKETIDHDLYKSVWTLQRYMSNMALCYTSWVTMAESLEKIVCSFESSKISYSAQGSTGDNQPRDLNSDGGATPPAPGGLDLSTLYFPKYLTGKEIFNLQLNDVNIRRQISIQMVILFTYLTTTSRFKSDSSRLSESQVAWVEKIQGRVHQVLSDSAAPGSNYAQNIKTLLGREELWGQWKEQSCQPFERQEVQFRKRNRVQETIESDATRKDKRSKFDFKNQSLQKDSTDNNVPGVDDFFEDVWEQLDPANGIEEEYHSTNNELWCWRAMRCLGKSKYFFEPAFTKDYPKTMLATKPPPSKKQLFVNSLHALEKTVKGIAVTPLVVGTAAATPSRANANGDSEDGNGVAAETADKEAEDEETDSGKGSGAERINGEKGEASKDADSEGAITPGEAEEAGGKDVAMGSDEAEKAGSKDVAMGGNE